MKEEICKACHLYDYCGTAISNMRFVKAGLCKCLTQNGKEL